MTGEAPLHPVRHRALRRRRPLDAGLPLRRLRRGGGQRRDAHRAAPQSPPCAGEGRRVAALEEGGASSRWRTRSTIACVLGLTQYDDTGGNIGKRYRRQDEIGTPFCVTVDFDSAGRPCRHHPRARQHGPAPRPDRRPARHPGCGAGEVSGGVSSPANEFAPEGPPCGCPEPAWGLRSTRLAAHEVRLRGPLRGPAQAGLVAALLP